MKPDRGDKPEMPRRRRGRLVIWASVPLPFVLGLREILLASTVNLYGGGRPDACGLGWARRWAWEAKPAGCRPGESVLPARQGAGQPAGAELALRHRQRRGSASVKGFGRRLAFESLRRTNPRAAGARYGVLGVGLGWKGQPRAGIRPWTVAIHMAGHAPTPGVGAKFQLRCAVASPFQGRWSLVTVNRSRAAILWPPMPCRVMASSVRVSTRAAVVRVAGRSARRSRG